MFSSSKGEAAIFLLSVCVFTETSSLLYNELRSLNVSCYPRDSCHHRHSYPSPENARERNTCECDASCYRRGTCCIDSSFVDPRQSTRNEFCDGERIIGVAHYYYFNDTSTYSFFQVPKCNPLWNGPVEVKQLCEMREPVDGVDLMVAIPVTNINSGVSYKNYFCAICNDDIEGSVLWDIGIYEEDYKSLISDRFDVQAVDDGFTENSGTCDGSETLTLVYNEAERSYGYWDYCQNSSPRFVWVTVTLSIPKDLEPYVKGCRSDVVSYCLPDWTNLRVRVKCGAYLGIIKAPQPSEGGGVRQYFRNVHCALCNNVTNFEGYSCEPFHAGAVITTPTYPTSFTVLFGHLLSSKGCLGNERFLTGLGCRAVVCANPRYKVKNGKCSPP